MAELLAASDPKALPPSKYEELYLSYLLEKEMSQLEGLLFSGGDPLDHRAIHIACSDLIEFDPSLAFYTLNFPKLLLPIFERAAAAALPLVSGHPAFKAKYANILQRSKQSIVTIRPASRLHIRLMSLPPVPGLCKPSINHVNSDTVSALVQIAGTVVRTGKAIYIFMILLNSSCHFMSFSF